MRRCAPTCTRAPPSAQPQARLDAGIGEFLNGYDLYPDARPCLQALKDTGFFVGVAGNQTARAGRLLRELNLPCDVLATSDEWGVTKPDAGFFDKMVAVSGHSCSEIAYVGDRLDWDIAPAARSGLSPSGSGAAHGDTSSSSASSVRSSAFPGPRRP
jgi:FMN phosphatase YigB (HAD superfamily)